MKFYHREKPNFFRFESSFLFNNSRGHFYLDTGKRDQVLGLFYEWEGDDWLADQLSTLAQEIEGHNYREIPLLEGQERFPLGTALYRRFILEIEERFIPWALLKGRGPRGLLCRCFGVYKEDIHELVGSGVELTSLRDIGDHLQAGIGCGTCREDLLATLEPLIPLPVKGEQQLQEQGLWEKLDPQSLAQEGHGLLKQFQGKNNQYGVLKLGGTRPGSILVSIEKTLGEPLKEKLKEELQSKFDLALGPGLKIVLLSL